MIPELSAMDRTVARPRHVTRRLLVVAVVVGLVVALAWVAFPTVRRWTEAESIVDGSRLTIATVVRGDMERDVAVQGRVVAARHPTLYSHAQGIVTLAVKAGTSVQKGDVLARVDSPELASRLAQEKATMASLESELGRQQINARQAVVRAKQSIDVLGLRQATAQRALDRAKPLLEQGLLTQQEYEQAEDEFYLANLELKNARETAQLESDTHDFEGRNRRMLIERQQAIVDDLERQVADLTLVAPFDGMVGSLAAQDLDAVARGQAILSVVSLTELEIELELPENYAADVLPGTSAEVQVQATPYAGRVTAVSPEVRDGQVRATVAFVGDIPPGLRQNERLSTRIVLERRVGVLKLPRGAFLEGGGSRQAYVVDSGVATRRAIEVGATSVGEVEIAAGLEEGERVIVSNTSTFEGATRVLLQD